MINIKKIGKILTAFILSSGSMFVPAINNTIVHAESSIYPGIQSDGLTVQGNNGSSYSSGYSRQIPDMISIYTKNGTIPNVEHIHGTTSYGGSNEYDLLTVKPDDNTFIKVDYSKNSIKNMNNFYDTSLTANNEYYWVGAINGGYFEMGTTNKPVGLVATNGAVQLWGTNKLEPGYGSGNVTSYFNGKKANSIDLLYHGYKNGVWHTDDGYDYTDNSIYNNGLTNDTKYFTYGTWTKNLKEGLSGGYVILQNGQESKKGYDDSIYKTSTSRAQTILGQKSDGSYLLVTTKAGLGGVDNEAAFMKSLGAVNAIRLDGGGSSQMVYDDGLVNNKKVNFYYLNDPENNNMSSIAVKKGNTPTVPEPTRNGYYLGGWFKTMEEANNATSSGDMSGAINPAAIVINDNTDYYAAWSLTKDDTKKVTLVVNFIDNDENAAEKGKVRLSSSFTTVPDGTTINVAQNLTETLNNLRNDNHYVINDSDIPATVTADYASSQDGIQTITIPMTHEINDNYKTNYSITRTFKTVDYATNNPINNISDYIQTVTYIYTGKYDLVNNKYLDNNGSISFKDNINKWDEYTYPDIDGYVTPGTKSDEVDFSQYTYNELQQINDSVVTLNYVKDEKAQVNFIITNDNNPNDTFISSISMQSIEITKNIDTQINLSPILNDLKDNGYTIVNITDGESKTYIPVDDSITINTTKDNLQLNIHVTKDNSDTPETTHYYTLFIDDSIWKQYKTSEVPSELPAPEIRVGYTFDGWYDDSKYTQEHDFSKGFTTDEDINIYGHYIKNKDSLYTVTTAVDGNIGGTITQSGSGSYHSGDSVTLTIAANTPKGYTFTSLTDNGEDVTPTGCAGMTGCTLTFSISENHNYVASFTKTRLDTTELTIDCGEHGTCTPGSNTYNTSDLTGNLEVKADSGYIISSFTYNGKELKDTNGNEISTSKLNSVSLPLVWTKDNENYNMYGNITVRFTKSDEPTQPDSPDTTKLTINCGNNGNCSLPSGTYDSASLPETMIVTANDGYFIESIKLNDKEIMTDAQKQEMNKMLSFDLNKLWGTIDISFTKYYSINTSSTAGGHILISYDNTTTEESNITLKDNTKFEVSFTTDNNYAIDKIIINGQEKNIPEGAWASYFAEQDYNIKLITKESSGTVGNATLKVNYVDKNGNVLAKSISFPYVMGSTYTISPKSIDGYQQVYPTSYSGTINNSFIELTFTYYKENETIQHNVVFETNGGNEISPIKVNHNDKITSPETPVKDGGYKFTGWYSDERCINKYDFNTPVTSDITLYAGWKKLSIVTVAIKFVDTTEPIQDLTKFNTEITVTDYQDTPTNLETTKTSLENMGYNVGNIPETVNGKTVKYTIPVSHKTTYEEKVKESSYTRTITYHYSDNSKPDSTDTQSGTERITCAGQKDEVTGAVSGDTTCTYTYPKTWEEITVPEVAGYTSDIKTIPANNTPNQNESVTVTYSHSDVITQVTIKFIDSDKENKQDLSSYNTNVNVTNGIPVEINISDKKEELERKHYIINTSIPTSVDGSSETVEIYVSHDTKTEKTFDENTVGNVTRTIKYQDTKGNKLADDVVQTSKNYIPEYDINTTDLVINTIIHSEHVSAVPVTFAAVTSPVITNFIADKQVVEAVNSSKELDDSTVIVRYTENPPIIITNADAKWTKGSNTDLMIASDGDFNRFIGVEVDNTRIDSTNYTATKGSTEITLNKNYLESLNVGAHEFGIISENGTASTTLTILKQKEKIKHTITYISGFTNIGKIEMQVEDGGYAKNIDEIEPFGYSFKGWMYNDKAFDFSTPITNDITLYAKWEENSDYAGYFRFNVYTIDENTGKESQVPGADLSFIEKTVDARSGKLISEALPKLTLKQNYSLLGLHVYTDGRSAVQPATPDYRTMITDSDYNVEYPNITNDIDSFKNQEIGFYEYVVTYIVKKNPGSGLADFMFHIITIDDNNGKTPGATLPYFAKENVTPSGKINSVLPNISLEKDYELIATNICAVDLNETNECVQHTLTDKDYNMQYSSLQGNTALDDVIKPNTKYNVEFIVKKKVSQHTPEEKEQLQSEIDNIKNDIQNNNDTQDIINNANNCIDDINKSTLSDKDKNDLINQIENSIKGSDKLTFVSITFNDIGGLDYQGIKLQDLSKYSYYHVYQQNNQTLDIKKSLSVMKTLIDDLKFDIPKEENNNITLNTSIIDKSINLIHQSHGNSFVENFTLVRTIKFQYDNGKQALKPVKQVVNCYISSGSSMDLVTKTSYNEHSENTCATTKFKEYKVPEIKGYIADKKVISSDVGKKEETTIIVTYSKENKPIDNNQNKQQNNQHSETGKNTSKDSNKEQNNTVVHTCQDAGYPSNYYWDESMKQCVGPKNNTNAVKNTASEATYISGIILSITCLTIMFVIVKHKKKIH